MTFVWDESKERKNRARHGISFATAASAFQDSAAVSYLDRVVDGEERWHTLGLIGGVIVLLVVHTSEEKMVKSKSVSSRREKRLPASVLFTTPLTDKQRREIAALARLPDAEIDLSDIPEMKAWPEKVEVGKFYRPIKQQISIRVDADVLAWFRAKGRKYQTDMNEVLRREMSGAGRTRRD